MTTQDEALERAFEAYDTLGTNAAFLSSLRESGWTLAPVEAPSPKELAIAARAHEPTFKCAKCYVVSYSVAPWCGNQDCPGRAAQEDESNG